MPAKRDKRGRILYYISMELFKKKQDISTASIPQVAGISPLLAEMLVRRGATDAASIQEFLNPNIAHLCDPFLFADMAKAVSCVKSAMQAGEKICVYGDYDTDGVCATSILYLCLQSLGADVCYHIPSRHNEGYGMNKAAVEDIAKGGTKLIITVDNGIKANEEADLIYALGMRLIITDHHLCGDILPRCEAAICHTIPGDPYPNKDICGAATAWKMACALVGMQAAVQYLPLAGLATVADVVALLGENRILVAEALRMLNNGIAPLGMLKLGEHVSKDRKYSAFNFAFGFAPRINAAGRLADATICVQLLCSTDEDEADQIASTLDSLNAERQAEEKEICDAAYAMLDSTDLTDAHVIVLKGKWNRGVVGIAASRIAERYYRPTILFSESDGVLTGSARSIKGVPLYEALVLCADMFTKYGGHAAAAGVSMRVENFEAFKKKFEGAVKLVAESETVFIPHQEYEADVTLEDVTMELAEDIERLAPFGEGNPSPLFRVQNATITDIKRMGDGSHLRAILSGKTASAPCVAFKMGDRYNELMSMGACDVLFAPSINEWRGNRSLQIQLRAVRASMPADPSSYIALQEETFLCAFAKNLKYSVVEAAQTPSVGEYASDESRRGCGTLILCFTAQGAKELLKTEDVYMNMDVRFCYMPKSACAYNTVVFAPVFDFMEIWRYKHIIVYDTPVYNGILAKLESMAPNAQIQVGTGDSSTLIRGTRMDRESFTEFYRAFRNSDRTFYGREDLVEFLCALTNKPKPVALVGIETMLELGFAREKGAEILLIQDAPRRNLNESVIYNAAQA